MNHAVVIQARLNSSRFPQKVLSKIEGKTLVRIIYERLKNELDKLGYMVQEDVFNTSDFGLPQHRRRLYIFAARKDLNKNDTLFNSDLVKNFYTT